MKRILVVLIAAFCLVLVLTVPHLMLNPGELVDGHQRMNNDCNACHKPFGGIDNSKCISCHKLNDIGKKSKLNNDTSAGIKILFHQHLANQECSSCHSDHKGMNAISSAGNFKHDLLEVEIISNCAACHGKPTSKLHENLSVNCGGCHTTASWKMNKQFNHDLIEGVDKSNCILCHQAPKDDYHSLAISNCEKCHSTSKWLPSTFEHNSFFALDGDHAAPCKTCHLTSNFQTYTCYGCHEHSESNIRGEHLEEGISDFTNCVSCHASGNEHDVKGRGAENGSGEKGGKGEGEEDDD